MQTRSLLRFCGPALVCAVAFCASDVWNSRDAASWSDDDINRILTDSPWAKEVHISMDSGMARRGGMGGGGGGMGGGGGIGSGGIGGGGIGGGIGGVGGGGMGRGGGGMGGGGGRGGGMGRGGGSNSGGYERMNVMVRWESARPIQDALTRRGDKKPDEGEAKAGRHYVISVVGLRAPSRNSDDGDATPSRRAGRDPDLVREELMSSTQLLIKGKNGLSPDDVKMIGRDSANGLQFFFAASDPISLDDKEVTFQTKLGAAKIEKKFTLKDMKYKGKLEL